ncbi:UNVERIFIED_CONTAM: Histone H1 [Sesamum radiatum]|uniref:Histone H1 n=1 Tax=Sesamum radiatum TaxID=300843 RepID=A0AAW2V8G0_SESRA
MDPALDPPPPAVQPTAAVSATAAAAANPTPAQTPAHSHPPYAEMITAAISALKERDGSSKRAIAKYIETHYANLPPTHSALLTHHLKRLKINGQVLMVKHSYKLPRSAPVAVNGAVNAVSADPASAGPKRRPGRPPKPKPEAGQAAVPVFAPTVDINSVPAAQPQQNVAVGPGTVYVDVGPVNGPAAGGPVRGRGRPPKQGGFKRGPGRPPKNGVATAGGGVGMGRARGRPKKNAAPGAAIQKGQGRPRGRPPRPINVVEGLAPGAPAGGGMAATPVADVNAPVISGGFAPVAGKRRGRPPKADGGAKKPRNLTSAPPKKPRKLSGKPLGRPKKVKSLY